MHESDELFIPTQIAPYFENRWPTGDYLTALSIHDEGTFVLAGTKLGTIQLWGLRVRPFTNIFSATLFPVKIHCWNEHAQSRLCTVIFYFILFFFSFFFDSYLYWTYVYVTSNQYKPESLVSLHVDYFCCR